MKTIKIILVAALLAALGFGIYKMVEGREPNGESAKCDTCIEFPKECNSDWAKEYIVDEYGKVPDGEFNLLKQRREEMQYNFKSMMADKPKKCQETVELYLCNRYQSRFVQMAENEFKGITWPHYETIKRMNAALFDELKGGSEALKKNKAVCDAYDKVLNYNAQVRNQCKQRPSSVNSKWNFEETKSIIDNTPSASEPVSHTTQYESSRQGNVKTLMYNGHVAFLDSLVNLARKEITGKPTKEHCDKVYDIVSKEVDQFKQKADKLYNKNYDDILKKYNKLVGILDTFDRLVKE